MFRHSVVLLVVATGCCIVNAAYFDQRYATKDHLEKQKKLYELTWHPSQPEIVNPELYQEGLGFKIEDNIENYTNKAAVEDFLAKWRHGMMHRGEIFTPFYSKLHEECTALFRLFYYAKDFDTFFKTAAWARVHVNEGQFMYALYSAVFRREDTKWMKLPPHYEMYPNAYYNSDVLTRARFAKRNGKLVTTKESDGYDTYVISGNYTSWYQVDDYDLEHKLNYLTEDIEWNYYYFLFRQEMPFWLKSEEFNFPKYRGEEYLYVHKQLLNRYYAERLSHGIPLFEDFDWHREFPVGYYPVMVYHNGFPYPQRPANSHFPDYKYKYIEEIIHCESRVADAIDDGHILAKNDTKIDIFTREGLSMLGNIIEGNEDSIHPDYYGSIDTYARKILGFNLEPSEPHNLLPSALESFSTSMRDPASYRLYKKIVGYYEKYKSHLKPYKQDDIVFPSLKIDSYDIDPLITYFDEYDSVVSNGMPVENRDQSDSLFVKIRQYRLNHVPFHSRINIQSTEDTQAVLRVFLGPKQDTHHRDMPFEESYQYFYELEHDIIQLKKGLNEITRICNNSVFTTSDAELGEKFYLKLEKALSGAEEFQHKQRVYGFPLRLILPRGNSKGMPFQLFVYVNPITTEPLKYNARIWGDFNMDNKPFGFPLDRMPAFDFRYAGFPNMLAKDVVIVHKENVNVVF